MTLQEKVFRETAQEYRSLVHHLSLFLRMIIRLKVVPKAFWLALQVGEVVFHCIVARVLIVLMSFLQPFKRFLIDGTAKNLHNFLICL